MGNTKRISISGKMTEVFISDVHFPFHDKLAWNLALKIVSILSPNIVWLGGDIVDFYAISRFIRNPERRLKLQEEIDVARTELKRLRAVSSGRMYFAAGNHEDRMRKFIWQNASELAGIKAITIPPLLNLKELEIEWIEHGQPVEIGKLHHIHGDEIQGGNVNLARGKLLKLHTNVIFGHHHRFQSDYIQSLDGHMHGAWANGCLCSMDDVEYIMNPQWTIGLSVIHYTKSGFFHVNQMPFFTPSKGKVGCVLDGQYIEC